MLTIWDVNAKSEEHVEQRIVSDCVFMSLTVSRGRTATRLGSFEEKNCDGKYEGVDGLVIGLDRMESVGELARDGTDASLGGLP